MKNNLKGIIFPLVILVVFILYACGGSGGETAMIKISLGKDMADKSTVGLSQLKHTVTLTGPTGTKTANLGPGGGSVSIAVAPGLWQISVQAFYGEELYAVGTESAEVKAGRSTSVLVQMTVVWTDTTGAPNTIPVNFDPGDGTPANPFKVFDVVTLQRVGKGADKAWEGDWALTAHYELIGTIDMTGVAFKPIGGFSYATPGTEFTGTFNGNSNTISGLKIEDSSPTGQGLFGAISGSTAEVKNLTLTGVTIGTASINNIGGLVGFNYGGTVENCNVSGSIKGNYNVGGLVGFNDGGTVENCNVSGSINGSYDMGGVVGKNDGGTIEDCSFVTGTVDGDNEVGGIVGTNTGDVIGCKFKGTSVNGSNYNIGGVVGKNEGVVDSCYAESNVTGNDCVGGVAGNNFETVKFSYFITGTVNGIASGYVGGAGGVVGYNYGTTSMVESCYSTGTVTGSDIAGGVAGWNEGTVKNSYSICGVSIIYNSAGGVVGYNPGTMMYCYSTGNVSGTDLVGGVVGENMGTVQNCVALNENITTMTTTTDIGRVCGWSSGGTISNNFGRSELGMLPINMDNGGSSYSPTPLNPNDGGNVAVPDALTNLWGDPMSSNWSPPQSWDWSGTWILDDPTGTGKLPTLQNMPGRIQDPTFL